MISVECSIETLEAFPLIISKILTTFGLEGSIRASTSELKLKCLLFKNSTLKP